MTPQERRAKYPIGDLGPLSREELDDLRAKTRQWIEAPDFTSPMLDNVYRRYARLLATIDEGVAP